MKLPPFNRKNLVSLCLVLGFFATACVVLLLVPPGSKYARWLPRCWFHEWTGLYCPGCGATRALSALIRGDLKTSLHDNLLLVPGTIVLTLLIAWPQFGLKRPVAVAIVVTVFAFTILRNIPCAPFTLLAPIP